eukprot:1161920-Pelagomonas_calceolata.AAC.2
MGTGSNCPHCKAIEVTFLVARTSFQTCLRGSVTAAKMLSFPLLHPLSSNVHLKARAFLCNEDTEAGNAPRTL